MRRILFVLLLVPALGAAQMQARGPRVDQPAQFLFFETPVFSTGGASLQRVDLLYRVDREFFIAVRNPDRDAPLPYLRQGEVLFELLDSTGTSRAREMRTIEIPETDQDHHNTPRAWAEGILSVYVAPGKYSVTFELTDRESRRNHLDNGRSIVVREADAHIAESLQTLLIAPSTINASSLTPVNFGGELLFGTPSALLLQVHGSGTTDSVEVRYRITAAGTSEDTTIAFVSSTRMERMRRGVIPVVDNTSATPRYLIQPSTDSSSGLVIVPFAAETLPLRDFVIRGTVRTRAGEQPFVHRFRMVWPDMPLSMRDVDYALGALRYLVSEDVLDSLKSGDYRQRRENLESFWKPKNPAPGTALNRVMAEYYRRIDHSMRSFATLKQPDGFKTDRGKVYVLQGPPDHTDRTLDPSRGYVEVWKYDRSKIAYTFLDANRTGDYRLISSGKE